MLMVLRGQLRGRVSRRQVYEAPKAKSFQGFSIRGCGAVGSAFEWHSKGRRFDPGQLHSEVISYYLITFKKSADEADFFMPEFQ